MRTTGRTIFALAFLAIGLETILCSGTSSADLSYGYRTLDIIPWLPPIPWLAVLAGLLYVACGVGLLVPRTRRGAALAAGAGLFFATLVLCLPRGLAHLGSISLRTGVFEPLGMGGLAWMMTREDGAPNPYALVGRYAVALSFIVFGADHFLLLAPIATLLPGWIPWHAFWVALFGAAFIAAGLALIAGYLQTWAAAGIALMFAIWVLSLHAPRVLGLYGVPGATQSPAEWQSLFIAIAFCGGSLAVAGSLRSGAAREAFRTVGLET
jgi:uncharacterized membrane protein